MDKRSPQARQLVEELDAELQANATQAGRSLGWSAAERHIIAMAADAVDRRVELAAEYQAADEIKEKVRISRELRLQEAAIAHLVTRVSTEVPAPESAISVKNRRAAMARWCPGAGA